MEKGFCGALFVVVFIVYAALKVRAKVVIQLG